jgi:hypothetical protein
VELALDPLPPFFRPALFSRAATYMTAQPLLDPDDARP